MDIHKLTINKETKVNHITFDCSLSGQLKQFLYLVRGPEEAYEDKTVRLKEHTLKESKEIEFVLSAEKRKELAIQARNEYLDNYKDSPHVDYELVDTLVRGDNRVLAIPLSLDLLKLKENFWKEREKAFHLWLDNVQSNDADELASKYIESAKENLQKIKEKATAGEIICVWQGNCGEDACGFEFLVSQLGDADCEIVLLELPADPVKPNGEAFAHETWLWNHIPMDCICAPMSKARLISKAERKAIITDWNRLVYEDSDLRVYEKGKIKSVPMSYYDKIVEEMIPEREFKSTSLVFALQENGKAHVPTEYWIERIFAFIRDKRLDFIAFNTPGAFWEYDCYLKKPGTKYSPVCDKVSDAFVKDVNIRDYLSDEVSCFSDFSDEYSYNGKDEVMNYLEKTFFSKRGEYYKKSCKLMKRGFPEKYYGYFNKSDDKKVMAVQILVDNEEVVHIDIVDISEDVDSN
ncbi:MAG: DUF1835 domain-containing protein [Eubacteriales bacterium]|nr:DUF1835 domain-containing protein [Eubacteriales bacterium]